MPGLMKSTRRSFARWFVNACRELPVIYSISSIITWVYIFYPNYIQTYTINFCYYDQPNYDPATEQYTSITCTNGSPSEPPSNLYYYLTMNLIFSLGVLIEAQFVQWGLAGFSDQEYQSFLLYTLCNFIDASGLVGGGIYFNKEADLSYFTDSHHLLICYILLAAAVNVVMNRCHTICFKLHNGYDEIQGLKTMTILGSGLFVCLITCVSYCFSKLCRNSGEVPIYLEFILRFALHMLDLMYTAVWCLAEVDSFQRYGLPGQREARDLIVAEQSMYQMMWITVKPLFFLMMLLTPLLYTPFVYIICSAVLVKVLLNSKCHSLLGYEIEMELKLDGVQKEDLHDLNKDCIICLEELVHNDKDSTCRFVGGDSVKLLACGHIFHYQCLAKWMGMKRECPTCKESVYKRLV